MFIFNLAHSHARKPLHLTTALPLTTKSTPMSSTTVATNLPPLQPLPNNPLSLTPEIIQSMQLFALCF